MNIPTDLKYTQDHEWLRQADELLVVGITDFAQSELGDIIFVEFPDIGAIFDQGETFGTVEAVKTVADLFMPLSGEVVEVNQSLDDAPEQVNSDPYNTGWLIKIRPGDPAQLNTLLDAQAYKDHIS
ncbi:MAG: glycine cleavage system protein GcvH [Candidatus Neomarinimicrobiota bacterium]